MRIAVESATFLARPTGIGVYARRLLGALGRRHDVQWRPFHFGYRRRPTVDAPFLSAPVRLLPAWLGSLGRGASVSWGPRLVPAVDDLLVAKGDDVDIDAFVFPNFIAHKTRARSFVFVYDASFVVAADTVAPDNARYLQRTVPPSIARADDVITISAAAAHDIVTHLGADPSRVHVVRPAIDARVFRPASAAAVSAVRSKHALPERYALFCGTLEPRKNLVRLIAAFTSLRAADRAGCTLVLAGGRGWNDAPIQAAIAEAGSAVQVLGYVDAAEQAALYTGARAFLFPSLYEGFGIPPLEAMACGTPSLVATDPALLEACGGAAVTVDARDTDDIAAGIRRVLGDDELRARLVTRGLAHARARSWDDAADELWTALRSPRQPR